MTASTGGEPDRRATAPASSGDRSDAAGRAADSDFSSDDDGATEAETATVVDDVRRETNRWKGVGAVALLFGGLAIFLRHPALLLTAALGVGYLGYARASAPPPVELAIRRSFDDPDPALGEEVTVTVTVENAGEAPLADLRLIDGVPDELAVVDGSARLGTALRPGESAAFEYTVVAKRGVHVFDSMLAIIRGPAGSTEREVQLRTDDALTCVPSLTPTVDVPLRSKTSRFTGRVETDSGGEGVEFHATREYRSGDPLNRIDWNRHARTGELATLQFRQERAATVVCVLDLRGDAYLRASEAGLHAADRGIEAAGGIFARLLDTGDRVGVAALSDRDVWLAPGSGNEHRARARELFATHPALSPTKPDDPRSRQFRLRQLRQRLPADAQLLLFAPLCDDPIVRVTKLLDAHGHLVTVVSPDPTATDTVGRRLARVERTNRITDLRETGVRVVDWGPEETLASAIARARRRWSG